MRVYLLCAILAFLISALVVLIPQSARTDAEVETPYTTRTCRDTPNWGRDCRVAVLTNDILDA